MSGIEFKGQGLSALEEIMKIREDAGLTFDDVLLVPREMASLSACFELI